MIALRKQLPRLLPIALLVGADIDEALRQMEAGLSGFGRHFEARLTEAEAVHVLRVVGCREQLPGEGQEIAVATAVDEVLWLMRRRGGLVVASHSTPTWRWATSFHGGLWAIASAGALRVTAEQRATFARLVAEIFETESSRVEVQSIEAAVAEVVPGGDAMEVVDIKRAAFAYGESRGLPRRPYAGPERRARAR